PLWIDSRFYLKTTQSAVAAPLCRRTPNIKSFGVLFQHPFNRSFQAMFVAGAYAGAYVSHGSSPVDEDGRWDCFNPVATQVRVGASDANSIRHAVIGLELLQIANLLGLRHRLRVTAAVVFRKANHNKSPRTIH